MCRVNLSCWCVDVFDKYLVSTVEVVLGWFLMRDTLPLSHPAVLW